MIGAILTALFPVFALVVLGFACEKRGWLGQGAEPALTRFVAQLSLPVLTFVTLATIDPHGLEAPALIGARGLREQLFELIDDQQQRAPGVDVGRERALEARLGVGHPQVQLAARDAVPSAGVGQGVAQDPSDAVGRHQPQRDAAGQRQLGHPRHVEGGLHPQHGRVEALGSFLVLHVEDDDRLGHEGALRCG